ncbi:MFS transporter [Nocardia sp. NPDC051321]|uniref:MFS transporter n=1 Tax=Nocardia sp. NPDC051321 TaxID=3364323 RepID=UPI00379D654A
MTAFHRDRGTVLGYAALGTFAYCLYALGPLLALLRTELGFSFAMVSLHTTAWAAGTVVTGLIYHRLAAHVGRHQLFWLSSVGAAVGALMFVAGHTVAVTVSAAVVLGTAGALVQTTTFAMLSDQHGIHRDRALVEANTIASAAAVLAPLALGWLAHGPLGWRAAMLLPVLAFGALRMLFGSQRLAARADTKQATGIAAKLPRLCVLRCILVSVVVGVEFCVVFYGAQLLPVTTGISTVEAATAMALFYVGELIGRVAGSGLTRRSGREWWLLVGSLALTGLGVLGIWLASTPWFALVSLSAAGLGLANLFPLSLALAVAAAEGQTDRAAARSQLLVGLAIGSAPLGLGALADQWGVWRGFSVTVLMVCVAAVLLAGSRRPKPSGHTIAR